MLKQVLNCREVAQELVLAHALFPTFINDLEKETGNMIIKFSNDTI